MSLPNIDLSRNSKQEKYFNTVFDAVAGQNDYRYFSYGGAVRGGKTYVTLSILALLSNIFPESKWHVVRSDFPVLESTTIPSFEKLIKGSPNWKMKRKPSNYHAENIKTGSKIFFKAENIQRDPMLLDFLGLETNGFFLEQTEELSKLLWEKALERSGSWYIDPMPPAFIFQTFNPCQNWVRDLVYNKWIKGELKSPHYFESALPKDNPFVTQDQWAAWANMAARYQKQFVEGDWTDFDDDANARWAFAFNKKRHVGRCLANRAHPLWLAFDFNKNPITCNIIQHYDETIFIPYTIKLANSDIYALCDHILTLFPNFLYMVTGDATGMNSSSLVKDNLNHYKVIKSKLILSDEQIVVPSKNPRLEENRVLVNSILANYDWCIDEENAKDLIFDLEWVKVTPDKKIDKSNRSDEKKQADTLDGLRYWCNVNMKWFLDLMYQ